MGYPSGETTKTDNEVSISILRCLKLDIFHAYFTKKMPQSRDSLNSKYYTKTAVSKT
jgi:hypothetical protein